MTAIRKLAANFTEASIDDEIVLIAAHHVRTFAAEHADDFQCDVLRADFLADG